VQRAQAPLAPKRSKPSTRGEKPAGVLRVLRALDEWLLQTPADLERITYEYLQDAAAHNVRYAEFFWNPTGTVQCSGMSYAAAQQAILAGAAAAQKDCGIRGRLVPSIDREAPAEAAVQMVQWMLDNRHDDVPGIGIDYRENERPPELFVEAYALARRNGLKTTAHASEFGLPWNNLQTAIETLKVDRVDHGYTVIDNPSWPGAAQIWALCSPWCRPTPTICARWHRALGAGPPDPPNAFHGHSHPPQHRRPHAAPCGPHTEPDQDGLRLWFFKGRPQDFMLNGIDAAWIDESERRSLRQQWSDEFDALSSTHHF
jgi:adenosine deaminase